MPRRVAALYVDPARGPYGAMAEVDPWGLDRNANDYKGPLPVVAHPPCAPWGRFCWRSVGAASRDGERECAIQAVDFVRRWGGVLEHPAGSYLWRYMGLPAPKSKQTDEYGCHSVEVRQADWGHPAEKKTWLYVCRAALPPVPSRREPTHVIVTGKYRGREGDPGWRPHGPKSQRHITPGLFARWLVDAAQQTESRFHPFALFTPQGDRFADTESAVRVAMAPGEFLSLTEGPPLAKSARVAQYARDMLAGAVFHAPWLHAEVPCAGPARVVGHEGRHRMAAAAKVGLAVVPTTVVLDNVCSTWSQAELTESKRIGHRLLGSLPIVRAARKGASIMPFLAGEGD